MQRDSTFILFNLGSEQYSVRGLGWVLGTFFGALLFAAFAAPLFWWLFVAIEALAPNGATAYILEKGFPKTFDRLRWIPLIILTPIIMHRVGMLSWKGLGFGWHGKQSLQGIAGWWLVGIVTLIVAAIGQATFTSLTWRPDATLDRLFVVALTAALSGIILGLLEEAILRGFLLRAFYTAMHPVLAVVLSAAFFAAVHFKDFAYDNTAEVTIASGLIVAWLTATSIFHTFELANFINLFLVGFALNLLFLRTRSLWPCVGLHAGWVWVLKVYKECVWADPEESLARQFWGTQVVLNGYWVSCVLGLLCIWLLIGMMRKRDESQAK